MLHATTWESCPAELLLSAAAPEDTGKDARLLEQLKQQNRRGLERVMKRYTAYVGTILRNVTRGQTTQEDLEELTADVFLALWHHAPEMRTEHLTGYLASIARSKGYNWLRKNRPETMPIDDMVISDDTMFRHRQSRRNWRALCRKCWHSCRNRIGNCCCGSISTASPCGKLPAKCT